MAAIYSASLVSPVTGTDLAALILDIIGFPSVLLPTIGRRKTTTNHFLMGGGLGISDGLEWLVLLPIKLLFWNMDVPCVSSDRQVFRLQDKSEMKQKGITMNEQALP